MSMQPWGYENNYDNRDRRHHHRGNEMEPFFGGGITGMEHQMRNMTRDLGRMETQMFGGFGNSGIGSMVDRSMRLLPSFIERDGQQLAQFQLDVKGFKPEDITIKTSDGVMTVTARHEDKGDDHVAIREFRRMVTVPSGMQMENMKSRLTPNGVLSIEAPFIGGVNRDGDHFEVPIQHHSSSIKEKR